MKRPNVEQIRVELNRRRLDEALAMARSDAILNARIGEAANTLVAGRNRELDDLEASIGKLATAATIDKTSRRSGSGSS